MKLRYQLTGRGWADASIELNGTVIQLTASYLSDALGDLSSATVALLNGSNEERFSFAEEPGEYRWILKRVGTHTVHIKILEFRELWGNKDDSYGVALLDAETTCQDFCSGVLLVLDELNSTLGPKLYKEQWVNNEFPLAQYEALKVLLAPK